MGSPMVGSTRTSPDDSTPQTPDQAPGLRYARLADTIKAEIATGLHPLGALLPTEADFCKRFGVSRHTVREALRRLVEMGLIARGQGAGTRVVATAPKAAYVHSLQSLSEVFQYTRDTRLHITSMDLEALNLEEAESVPAPCGSRWLKITGVRRTSADGGAIAYTNVYVHGRFAEVLADLRSRTGPVYATIEERTGEIVVEARQIITAGPMPPGAAAALKVKAGAPAIRVLRRYLDASGGAMLTALNWHPADRFVYAITLRRDSPE